MGLRTASVRRLSSETMAPALTETKTSDSFKLTPKTSHSACDQATVDAAFAAASAFDDSIATTAQTALIRKGLIKSDAAFDLAHFQLAAELLNNDIAFDRCKPPSIDNDIMNNTESGNMGLQQPPLRDSQQLQLQLKDEKIESHSVDQMLFGDNMPPLHSDDDLMQQVIKSIVASDTGEEELPLTPGDLATLPGNLSSLEKALFNAVDMINIGMAEEQLMDGATTVTAEDSKDVRTKELITQVRGKQARLERKVDFLVRRLRKMQVRYMGQHVGAEVAGVYEHAHRTLRRLKEQGSSSGAGGDTNTPSHALDLSVTASLISAEMAGGGDAVAQSLKPISHSAAKSLVKKLENTRYLQANSSARQRHSARFFGSGSIEPTSFRTTAAQASGGAGSSVTMTTLPTWPSADKASLRQTAGQLRAQLALVQCQLDSDATLSSSGGESCDEMQTYGNVHQQYLAIQKRAAWKYSSDRASIAARWSWLLAQIADLEYRIRQHTDLHRLMRTRKGPVILQYSCAAKCLSAGNNTAAVNGYRGVLPGDNRGGAAPDVTMISDNNPSAIEIAADAQHTGVASVPCARARPLNTSAFAKRRLVQTGGLHAVSKKAARPATVRCTCVGAASRDDGATHAGSRWRGPTNCAVCTGRGDATHPRDPTEHLSRTERIALLDGGYHPVVSLAEDTSISIHMEAIMKSVEWQQRSSRSSLKAMKYAIKADRMNCDREKQQQQQQQQLGGGVGGEQRVGGSGRKGGGLEHRKKYNRMGGGASIKGSTVSALTAKLKSGRPRGRKPNRHNNNTTTNNLSQNKKHRRHSHHHQQRTKEHATAHHHQHQQLHYNSNDDIDDDIYDDDDDVDDDHYASVLDDPDYRPIIGEQYVVGVGGGGGGGSRCGSPLLATQSISGFGRRNRVDSYDIDNIVIPYSVAASTRVERLQYKEILTPKWRLVDTSNLPPIKYENKNNGVVKITSQESDVSDVEDISVDAVQQRHDKSEQEEKRKFLSYLKLPLGYYGNTAPSARRHHHHHHHQQQQHKRTDSRAESSGANTPDNPMSPAAAVAAVVQQQGDASGGGSETPVASPPTMDLLRSSKVDDLPDSLRNLPLSSLSALRRRTISASSSRWLPRDSTSNDATVDQQQQQQQQLAPIVEVPPYDRRQFPLSEENFGKMVRGMPDGHHHHKGATARPMMNVRNQDNGAEGGGAVAGASSSLTTPPNIATTTPSPSDQQQHQHRPRRSHQSLDAQRRITTTTNDIDSESTESAFGDEDPNDPEWDMDDQVTCAGRNAELGRFRR